MIVYAGPGGHAALTLGDGAGARNAAKLYQGLRVQRATISDWLNEADIGILLRNLDASTVEIRQAEGAAILAQQASREANILAYNDVFLLIAAIAVGTIVWASFHIFRVRRENLARIAAERAGANNG